MYQGLQEEAQSGVLRMLDRVGNCPNIIHKALNGPTAELMTALEEFLQDPIVHYRSADKIRVIGESALPTKTKDTIISLLLTTGTPTIIDLWNEIAVQIGLEHIKQNNPQRIKNPSASDIIDQVMNENEQACEEGDIQRSEKLRGMLYDIAPRISEAAEVQLLLWTLTPKFDVDDNMCLQQLELSSKSLTEKYSELSTKIVALRALEIGNRHDAMYQLRKYISAEYAKKLQVSQD